MAAALMTVILFSLSGLAGERTARLWGGQMGNFLRLTLAMVLMWFVVLLWFRDSVRPETFGWLVFSGAIGFGFGDIALFIAYVRIGARLTILLNLCTAPIWGALLEKVWLGTSLTGFQLAAGGVILAGVSIALLARPPGTGRGSRWVGILGGLAAGCGQGMGAVISRKAFETAAESGFVLNGFSAAAQRVAGGFATVLVLILTASLVGRHHFRLPACPSRARAVAWLLMTALCGPILGVSCFQWSLRELPAAITMAVVATTPVAMIPLTMAVDGERPKLLSVMGSAVAVGGVIWMLLIAH